MNGDVEAGVKVTRSMIEALRATKPWTKLLAILGFIGVVFMLLAGAGLMLFGNIFPQQQGGAPTVVMGVFYILLSVLYYLPAHYLYKYSSSIASFLKSNGTPELESALSYQKSFWKFIGILALIGVVIGILGIAAAIAIPIITRMGMQQPA